MAETQPRIGHLRGTSRNPKRGTGGSVPTQDKRGYDPKKQGNPRAGAGGDSGIDEITDRGFVRNEKAKKLSVRRINDGVKSTGGTKGY